MPLTQRISTDERPLVYQSSLPWSGLEALQVACLGVILLSIEPPSMQEELRLTPREIARMEGMGPRRQMSFTTARVALKRLTRQLGLVESDRPDSTIETISLDDQRPYLGESKLFCSVSHKGRIVVAVAHSHPVGVDLEEVSEKALRVLHPFGIGGEQRLIARSSLGAERAATRVWTSKEAVSKALGLHLFQALQEVEVVYIGEMESQIRFQGKSYPVKHSEGERQVLTLITCDQ